MRRMKTCEEIQECANETTTYDINVYSGTIIKNVYLKCINQNKRLDIIIEGQFKTASNSTLKMDINLPVEISKHIFRYDGTDLSMDHTSDTGITQAIGFFTIGGTVSSGGTTMNTLVFSGIKNKLELKINIPNVQPSTNYFISTRFELAII